MRHQHAKKEKKRKKKKKQGNRPYNVTGTLITAHRNAKMPQPLCNTGQKFKSLT